MAKVIEKYPDLLVISDEIYELITFGNKHESIAQFSAIKEQIVIVNGVSKGFAMTGWRVGYMAGPAWLAKACSKFQGQITSGANAVAQRATKTAVEANPETVQNMVETFQSRRDLILDLLNDIPGIKTSTPSGAFYVLPDVSAYFGKSNGETSIENAGDFSMYLLEEAQVALVEGTAFGVPNCVRISYANSEEQIKTGLTRMKEALAKLS